MKIIQTKNYIQKMSSDIKTSPTIGPDQSNSNQSWLFECKDDKKKKKVPTKKIYQLGIEIPAFDNKPLLML